MWNLCVAASKDLSKCYSKTDVCVCVELRFNKEEPEYSLTHAVLMSSLHFTFTIGYKPRISAVGALRTLEVLLRLLG